LPKECSLTLTRDEAEYLAERIRLSPVCSDSLLAELVAHRQRYGDVPFAWQHKHCTALPSKLRELLDHAQNFSDLSEGNCRPRRGERNSCMGSPVSLGFLELSAVLATG